MPNPLPAYEQRMLWLNASGQCLSLCAALEAKHQPKIVIVDKKWMVL